MRLVTKPEKHQETFLRPLMCRVFGVSVPTAFTQYRGRITYNKIYVEGVFSNSEPQDVEIDGYSIKGLYPISETSPGIFLCAYDTFTIAGES